MVKVTKNYLNYDSEVKMEIIDTYFDSLELPPIKLEFDFYSLLKLENFSSNLIEVFGSNVIKNPNGFKRFHNQIKNWNIFDCKILNDGVYQDCNLSLDNIIDIKFLSYGNYLNYPDYKTILKDSRFERNIFLTFNLFNPESKAMKNSSKFLAHKLVQKNFIKIYLNKPELNARYRFAYSEKLFKPGFSSFSYALKSVRNYPKQADYIIFKKKFSYLKHPFESKCIIYGENNNYNLFYSLSKDHCIRQCFRYHCESMFNCSCLLLDNNMYQIDYGFNNLNNCQNIDQSSKFIFTEKCNTLCPIDCETEENFMVNRDYVVEEKLESNSSIYSFSWDDSNPYIKYNEIPVLTFRAYLCYIGGLFGMWFGFSANKLLKKIEDNYLIYFRTIVHYSLVFYYILLELLLIAKAKFRAFL
jgi:hypothetical protein